MLHSIHKLFVIRYDMSMLVCPVQTPGYCVAYVGNIAFEATEADLRAVFEGLAVARVRMHTDAASGRFKGYAHVHFSDEASLDSCAPGPQRAVTGFAWDSSDRTSTALQVLQYTKRCLPSASLPYIISGVNNRATWSRMYLGTAGPMQGHYLPDEAQACGCTANV